MYVVVEQASVRKGNLEKVFILRRALGEPEPAFRGVFRRILVNLSRVAEFSRGCGVIAETSQNADFLK